MRTTLTIEAGDDIAEVHAMVDRILGEKLATASKTTTDAKPETAKAKKIRLAAEKAAAEASTAAAESELEGPTREDVRTKLRGYAAIEGKDAAIAILVEHEADSIGELDESKFAAVIAAVDKAESL